MTNILPFEISQELRRQFPKANRPIALCRWIGGKVALANWIVQYIPPGTTYVEAYSGLASVFFNLRYTYESVVLNDKDAEVVTFLKVMQDPEGFESLAHRLTWTPYALDEFRLALHILANKEHYSDVDIAWAFFVRQNQGFGGVVVKTEGRWGRSFTSSRGMSTQASSWYVRRGALGEWHKKLEGVAITNQDALEVIAEYDSPDTVFYLDPPYLPDTRIDKVVYAAEADREHHEHLVKVLLSVRGKVVLSGYPNWLYEQLEEAGWVRFTRKTTARVAARHRRSKVRGAGKALEHAPREEVLWCNPNAYESLPRQGAPLI